MEEAEEVEAEEVEVEEVEAEEVEAEEVEADKVEAEELTPLPCLASDSAETPPRYSLEKEKRQTASSPNSNVIIWPTSEFQNSILGSERSSSPAPTSKALSLINGSTEQ